MILSNTDILKAIRQRRIIINPLPEPDQFSPSALDLRVGTQFLKWKKDKQGAELQFDLSTVNIPAYRDYIAILFPSPSDFEPFVGWKNENFFISCS